LTERRLHRLEVLAMIKRRARQAQLPSTTCCHSFRATGITTYLQNGGIIEHAQQMASHESPRTTKVYDRSCYPGAKHLDLYSRPLGRSVSDPEDYQKGLFHK
jgi:integrase